MNKKYTPVIAIGVIVIALLAYIAINTKVNTSSSPVAEHGTFTPLSNNQTLYVNREGGFQVSYPSDWTIDKEFEGRKDGADNFVVEDMVNKYQGTVSISVSSTKDCDTVTSCMQVKDDTLPTSPFTIGGVTVQAYLRSPAEYTFLYNRKLYDIDFEPSGNNKADYPAFQNMLASFKFI